MGQDNIVIGAVVLKKTAKELRANPNNIFSEILQVRFGEDKMYTNLTTISSGVWISYDKNKQHTSGIPRVRFEEDEMYADLITVSSVVWISYDKHFNTIMLGN